LGLDLGFVYTAGAVVSQAGAQPLADDPIADYRPTTWPGARLPHLWLRDGNGTHALHDFLSGSEYLVLIHPGGANHWREAVRIVQKDCCMPLRLLSIGAGGEADLVDDEGKWKRLSEITPTGAVLVRPDGHVAWRCPEAPADAVQVLRQVLLDPRLAGRPA
jgi:2,4-dichlorophenol 6-monooxygenase